MVTVCFVGRHHRLCLRISIEKQMHDLAFSCSDFHCISCQNGFSNSVIMWWPKIITYICAPPVIRDVLGLMTQCTFIGVMSTVAVFSKSYGLTWSARTVPWYSYILNNCWEFGNLQGMGALNLQFGKPWITALWYFQRHSYETVSRTTDTCQHCWLSQSTELQWSLQSFLCWFTVVCLVMFAFDL
jgi:hypothetical protein